MELKGENKLANIASYPGNGGLGLYVWWREAVEDYVIWENHLLDDRSLSVCYYYYKIFYSNSFTIKGLVHMHSIH